MTFEEGRKNEIPPDRVISRKNFFESADRLEQANKIEEQKAYCEKLQEMGDPSELLQKLITILEKQIKILKELSGENTPDKKEELERALEIQKIHLREIEKEWNSGNNPRKPPKWGL